MLSQQVSLQLARDPTKAAATSAREPRPLSASLGFAHKVRHVPMLDPSALMKYAVIEPKAFAAAVVFAAAWETFAKFCFASLRIRPEVVLALQGIKAEPGRGPGAVVCQGLGPGAQCEARLSENIFSVDHAQPLRLDEFRQNLRSSCAEAALAVKEDPALPHFAAQRLDVRKALAAKHEVTVTLLMERLVRRLRIHMDETTSDVRSLAAKIMKPPKNVVELVQMRNSLGKLPAEISELHVRIQKHVKLYDQIEGFCHQLSPEDFRMRWELVAAPYQARHLLAKPLGSRPVAVTAAGALMTLGLPTNWSRGLRRQRHLRAAAAEGRVRALASDGAGRTAGAFERDPWTSSTRKPL
eukprot:Skav232032  [mRNA]  locus=scaffold2323:68756:88340:+ [translate_table: standard]